MAKAKWTLMERYDDVRQRTGQPPVLQAACYQRAAKAASGRMEFILSMPGIKRDGFDIVQKGWQLEGYRNNPLVLWRHSDRSPSDIMGTCPKAWLSNAEDRPTHLRGLLDWSTEEKNPSIGPVRAMYEDGTLRAVSVRWEDDGLDSLQEIGVDELRAAKVDPMALMMGGIRFMRAHLIEWSLVPLGMDKQALSVRCQRGDIPQNQLDRFVATIRDDQLITDDGREVLMLDGHPARFETERNPIVDMGAVTHRAAEDAASGEVAHTDTDEERGDMKMCPECKVKNPVARETCDNCGASLMEESRAVASTQAWLEYPDARAYRHACQRFLRGTLSGDGLDEHLAREGERLGVPGPEAGLGLTYFDLHEALAKTEDEGERQTLRTVIVQVGKKHFGEARLREAWEPRSLPEPESAWAPVSSLLEVGLRAVVVDGEERDALVDTLIAGLDAAIGDQVRAVDLSAEVERLKALVAAREDEPAAPQPERAAVQIDPAPAVDATTALAEIANHIESRHLGKPKAEPTMKSLLASLLETPVSQ